MKRLHIVGKSKDNRKIYLARARDAKFGSMEVPIGRKLIELVKEAEGGRKRGRARPPPEARLKEAERRAREAETRARRSAERADRATSRAKEAEERARLADARSREMERRARDAELEARRPAEIRSDTGEATAARGPARAPAQPAPKAASAAPTPAGATRAAPVEQDDLAPPLEPLEPSAPGAGAIRPGGPGEARPGARQAARPGVPEEPVEPQRPAAPEEPAGQGEPSVSVAETETPPPKRFEPSPASRLSPADIQTLLRAGRGVRSVAQQAEAPLDWIRRLAAPIEAERLGVVTQLLQAFLTRARLGRSALPVGPAMVENLRDRGVRFPERVVEEGWSATRSDSREWRVRFTYESRGRTQRADWRFDPQTREVRAGNALGADLGYRPPSESERATASAAAGIAASIRPRVSAGRSGTGGGAKKRRAPAKRGSAGGKSTKGGRR